MNTSYTISLSEILRGLISESGISEAELARKIKIPTATLNKLKTGKIDDPRSSTLKIIANYFNLSIDQLLGNAPVAKNKTVSQLHVPMLSYDQAVETDIKSLSISNHKDWVSFDASSYSSKQNLFALRATGSAMTPVFDEGTVIIIDREADVTNFRYVLVYLADSGSTVLRQILLDGNVKIIKPINSAFEAIKLTAADVIIGVVIYSIRKYI